MKKRSSNTELYDYLGALSDLLASRGADYARAFAAFTTGAALDEPTALYDLGVLYRRGLGVPKQPHKARPLFERAAALGNVFAQRDLAFLLLCGHGGFRQRFQGLALLRSSIKELWRVHAQDPDSQRLQGQLGRFHQFWYRKARSQ